MTAVHAARVPPPQAAQLSVTQRVLPVITVTWDLLVLHNPVSFESDWYMTSPSDVTPYTSTHGGPLDQSKGSLGPVWSLEKQLRVPSQKLSYPSQAPFSQRSLSHFKKTFHKLTQKKKCCHKCTSYTKYLDCKLYTAAATYNPVLYRHSEPFRLKGAGVDVCGWVPHIQPRLNNNCSTWDVF